MENKQDTPVADHACALWELRAGDARSAELRLRPLQSAAPHDIERARLLAVAPNNFVHVGLIHAILPDATIIDVHGRVQIGVARAAYFPVFSLAAAAGFDSASPSTWLNAPSRLWAAGPEGLLTVFDAGRRRAQSAQAHAKA